MIWKFLRLIFFQLDAEKAHYAAMDLFNIALKIPLLSHILKRSFLLEDPALETTFCGMPTKNPVGLAAGFDKDGKWLDLLCFLGFGHIELGTVTPKPQEGNPKPRLFRLKKDRSIINRMGFNNAGAEQLKRKLVSFKKPDGMILGINIGKNKTTTPEHAIEDFLICFRILKDYADYFTINVSSPNTPGLRDLQEKEPLNLLLAAIQSENKKFHSSKPLFLKIAPDLNAKALDDILEVVIANQFTGIIVNNTTIDRPAELIEKELSLETGGLSGAILKEKAGETLAYLTRNSNSGLVFIGVGGIMTPDDAIDRMHCGAQFIQLYSGLIYSGPWLVKEIKKSLVSYRRES